VTAADAVDEKGYDKAPAARVERASSNGVVARDSGGRDSGYGDRARGGAMEVIVENNIEKAMRILKRKLIKEGLFKELKSRRYYEKPSVRRKRKEKEAQKKVRKEEARAKKNNTLFS
jgi:small subunit ribosomal protein S21